MVPTVDGKNLKRHIEQLPFHFSRKKKLGKKFPRFKPDSPSRICKGSATCRTRPQDLLKRASARGQGQGRRWELCDALNGSKKKVAFSWNFKGHLVAC